MKFNKKQELAIHFGLGAGAVIAGAGSGKSTVLTYRTQYLVNNLKEKEEDILILSFTSNAKDNMIEKLKKVGIKNVQVHTFHSLCKKIITSEGLSCKLINGEDEDEDFPKIHRLFRGYNKRLSNGDIAEIMSFINYQKKYGVKYNEEFKYFDIDVSKKDLSEYFKIYEDYKTDNNKTDFEDWINISIKILENNPNKYTYKFLMCDEHQDTNLIQNQLINLLCPSKNIMCVFDYRQSIYGFSGANPEYCMNFDKDYNNATIINLDVNYRSCKDIVESANGFIRRYYGDYKHYSDSIPNNTRNGEINKITTYSRNEEGDVILEKIKQLIDSGENPNDIAVLYRLTSHSDILDKKLKDNNIKHVIQKNKSANFFKRKEIKFVIDLLKLIENTSNDIAFEDIYNARGTSLKFISKITFKNVIKSNAGRYNLSLFQSLTNLIRSFKDANDRKNSKEFINNIENLRLQKDNKIELSKMLDNIYKVFELKDFIMREVKKDEQINRIESLETLKSFAKGRDLKAFLRFVRGESKSYTKEEKDGVKMMTIHKSKGLEFKHVFIIGVESGKFPHDKSDLLEEARLFYVAVTRAKENLTISQIYEDNKFVEEYFESVNEVQNEQQIEQAS